MYDQVIYSPHPRRVSKIDDLSVDPSALKDATGLSEILSEVVSRSISQVLYSFDDGNGALDESLANAIAECSASGVIKLRITALWKRVWPR